MRSAGETLRLEVRDFTDLTSWRWVLKDANDHTLADRDVRLDRGSAHFEAFTDLLTYISWHATPDHADPASGEYARNETRIVAETGAWAGEHVLGDAITAALLPRAPATVRVIVPGNAEALALLPLELAHAEGKSLVAHDITLVTEITPESTRPAATAPGTKPTATADGPLRVLGLFSLPDGGSPLNLRRERESLVKLIRGIAADGRAAEVKVLQYGVTRDRLTDVLEEAEGWDVIHISGHGAPGEVLLETATGAPDRIPAAELARLLAPARGRVSLVMVAACWSAALTAAEQRRLLRLPTPENQRHISAERPAQSPPARPSPASLAAELVRRLGCAVVAMRYPVGDEFAIALSGKLYDLLARQGQPLPRAVAMTLNHLADGANGRRFPALSMAAPAVFGTAAASLTLTAPVLDAAPSVGHSDLKMAGFPPPPERFVGRTGVMARASAALAKESGVPGVLLHGMPGGGKTACALELAHGHEDAFPRLIWFKAPDEGTDITGALMDFALKLEGAVGGFPIVDKLADDAKLTAFLPKLTALMSRLRLLLVVDNAESLLTSTGQWRDDRWGEVVTALTAHKGFGRLILTSRRVPADVRGLHAESVDALTADEALLLARELPNLDKLIRGDLPGIDRAAARKLAVEVLTVAQGHPKLLELADGQAAHADQVAALVESGGDAWREQGGLPDGFFTTGETTASAEDYLQILATWTNTVTANLSPGERDLFWFLCCLEEPDRIRPVLDGNWSNLWQRLGRDGQPPTPNQTLPTLAAHGLTAIRSMGRGIESYAVHPGVAAAGRNHAGPDFRAAVDTELGAFWYGVYQHASGENDDGSVDTRILVRAGLSAVPYLFRQQHWDTAANLLDGAFLRDPSRANAAAMLPAITRIADRDPRAAGVLALILQTFDPVSAETRLRAYLDSAAARGDYWAASVAAGRLADLCRDSGRLAEALTLADTAADYTRQAGLGPWTQLADQGRRLQVLAAMGHAGQVLDDVQRLRRLMDALPIHRDPDEAISSWDVRETLLGTGCYTARQLGRWQDALDLSAEITASERARHAPASDTARTRFGDYPPLLKLGRTDEALNLLLGCRQVFHDTGDIQMLGKTLSALAETEYRRGHGDAALRLERDALRYTYLAADVTDIAISYHNLGHYLRRHSRQPAAALAAHLTASLICGLSGIGGTGSQSAAKAIRSAAIDLREFGAAATPPDNVADLCDRLADIEGPDLPALIARFSPDPGTAEQTLRALIAQARERAESRSADGSRRVLRRRGRT